MDAKYTLHVHSVPEVQPD